MEIKIVNPSDTTIFRDLKDGELFVHLGTLYIRRSTHVALPLDGVSNGSLTLNDTTPVRRVKNLAVTLD